MNPVGLGNTSGSLTKFTMRKIGGKFDEGHSLPFVSEKTMRIYHDCGFRKPETQLRCSIGLSDRMVLLCHWIKKRSFQPRRVSFL